MLIWKLCSWLRCSFPRHAGRSRCRRSFWTTTVLQSLLLHTNKLEISVDLLTRDCSESRFYHSASYICMDVDKLLLFLVTQTLLLHTEKTSSRIICIDVQVSKMLSLIKQTSFVPSPFQSVKLSHTYSVVLKKSIHTLILSVRQSLIRPLVLITMTLTREYYEQ